MQNSAFFENTTEMGIFIESRTYIINRGESYEAKETVEPKNINALLVITVIIISILVTALAYMTIGNTDNLAEYASQIYQKPYAVNDAAWRMRLEILYARNTMLDLLNSDGNRQQQQDALDNMYRYRGVCSGNGRTP